ncbi:hypothetical protein RvY_14470-2 [Ramazzottius varieornatus]|uniref:Uncharacterized protein n=1 Tax=Ramazzottius varieornatus TaxID=947166 RepID=A0A1D1VRE8_RAMVA|nr:hypothetical protein RvY_14470-2 [Ramazzottius varieornatus]
MAAIKPVPASASKWRKKTSLTARVRQQLEFYFGDANLGKDRFLQEKIQQSEDGFVPLDILLTFNKLRELTTEIPIVREAVRTSQLLRLSEDGLKIQRTTPLEDRGPVDERTLYVENLPPTADIDWVTSRFAVFGDVVYVSLPRFNTPPKNAIKGFAFVEFKEPEGVEQACQYFTSPDGDVAEAYAKEAALPVVPSITVADFDEEDLVGPHGHKRKRDEVMEADAQDPTPVATEPASSKSKTDERPQVSEAKEPKSGKSKSKNRFAPDLLPLRVMPKVKWTELKKRYLDLQKASYKALKQKLKLLNVGDAHSDAMDGDEDGVLVSDDEDNRMDFQESKGKNSRKKNGWTKKAQPQKDQETMKPLEFPKGLIVQLKYAVAVTDKKQVIKDLRSIPHVAFVDVSNDTEVFVRCDEQVNTAGVMESLSQKEATESTRLVEGEEERTYWEKIQNDMKKRSEAGGNRRGKAKLVNRAERIVEQQVKSTHIKFE